VAGGLMGPVESGVEVRIAAGSPWWRIDFAELWRYRDLWGLMVRRDFKARYAQSVLGPAWFILQPLLTTLVFTVVFGQIAGIPTGGVPPVLFYLCNQLGWAYFAAVFTAVSGTFTHNSHLFSKVYFPRLIVPCAAVATSFVPTVIQLASFGGFWLFFGLASEAPGFALTPWAALAPAAFLQLAVLAAGVGMCVAALTAKYRDLAQVSALLVQLWMYASPVIFPLAEVPERWRWLVAWNPVTFPVELIRLGFLGVGEISAGLAAASVGVTLAVAGAGLALFAATERDFVDYV
jgi:lipopolysaccharide transport system permease protein